MQVLLILAISVVASAAAETPADELLRRVEERNRRTVDLTARFVQSYRSGMLGHEIVESGSLSVKRPGRMRWEYEEPEVKTFVADGQSFYFYVPADRQVIVQSQSGQRGVAVTLLSGDGSLSAEFEVSLPTGSEGRLRLTPREPDPDVREVLVDVGPAGEILAIEVLDVQANRSRYEFYDTKTNVGLPESLFSFDIPEGVEVIQG